MINTIETRLRLNMAEEFAINSCVELWSWGYRKTWRLWNNYKLNENEIYSKLINLNLFTSYQIKSLISKVKAEHSKIKELTKSQCKQHQSKLNNINKFISKESKIIEQYNKDLSKLKSDKKLNYSKIADLSNSIKKKQLVLDQKQRKSQKLAKTINLLHARVKSNTFKLCFGSSSLLSKRPGKYLDKFRLTDNQKVYDNLEDWKFDWNLSRNNVWISIGDKTKPQGNAEIQYYPSENKLRLRVTEQVYLNRLKDISEQTNIPFEDLNDNSIIKNGTYRMKARFIEIKNVEFCKKNQAKLIQSLNNKQPITAKIVKKLTPNGRNIGFYLQLSFDEILINPIHLNSKPKTMGIDLNEKGLAYCIVKSDGNKLKDGFGFVQWDLNDKSTKQRTYIISNCITEVLTIAQNHGVYSISIENLDFSSVISNMNSGYRAKKQYNKMLTQFAKSKFKDLIVRKTERLGITVNLVNPSYSSIGGYAKYGVVNKLPVDISASLWLARQAILGEEFKKESNIKFIKKHEERISLPYMNQPKQSKKLIYIEKEWKDIGLELGKNRKLWYSNIIKFIQSSSVDALILQEFNPFEDQA
jgi:IS605 OrfB family transposase